MKDRLKKFWNENREEVVVYIVGVGVGALSYAIYHKVAFGDNVKSVDHMVYADGHEKIFVYLNDGGIRSFSKRLDVA